MKVYVIKSDYSEVPLAEVRTDGDTVDFVVDNTNGKLPQMVQSSLPKLRMLCDNSSHMRLEEPKKATVNLLRYVMDNGDVVEITSDGHTCHPELPFIAARGKGRAVQRLHSWRD